MANETNAALPAGKPSGAARPIAGGKLASFLGGRWIYFFLLLEIVYFSLRTVGFASLNSLQILLFYGVLVFLVSTAELFVIATGGIDLSVGYVLGFASIISIKLMEWMKPLGLGEPLTVLLGIALTLVVGLVPGLINGWLVAYLKVPPFIATFSMLGVCHGVSELVINGVYAMGLPALASTIGNGHFLYVAPGRGPVFFLRPIVERGVEVLEVVPNIVVVTAVVVAIFAFVLARTRFGRHVYAIGGNVDAAIRAGIPVKRRLLGVYAVSSLLATLGGVVYAFMYVSGKADAGASLLLDAIAAVVIGGASMFGGTGTVGRTMIGALIIAVLELGLRMSGVPTFDKYIMVGVILILAVVVERYVPEARK
jgi:ribose/xylose/arabinose/galactoside ABC-type transport system permease subunit